MFETKTRYNRLPLGDVFLGRLYFFIRRFNYRLYQREIIDERSIILSFLFYGPKYKGPQTYDVPPVLNARDNVGREKKIEFKELKA